MILFFATCSTAYSPPPSSFSTPVTSHSWRINRRIPCQDFSAFFRQPSTSFSNASLKCTLNFPHTHSSSCVCLLTTIHPGLAGSLCFDCFFFQGKHNRKASSASNHQKILKDQRSNARTSISNIFSKSSRQPDGARTLAHVIRIISVSFLQNHCSGQPSHLLTLRNFLHQTLPNFVASPRHVFLASVLKLYCATSSQ